MKYKGKHYHRVFYVGTVYALLLYLLRATQEEIADTCFLIDYTLPRSVAAQLSAQGICLHNSERYQHFVPDRFPLAKHLNGFVNNLYSIYVCRTKIPPFEREDILYAQDHLLYSRFICGRDYTLVEDSAGIFSNLWKRGVVSPALLNYRKTVAFRLRRFLTNGRCFLGAWGVSEYCRRIIVSQHDDAPYIRHLQQDVVDMEARWKAMPESQRQQICDIFGFLPADIAMLRSRPIVLYTQCLYSSFDTISKEQQIDFYRRILSHYDHSQVLIKNHPRDHIDYTQYFPDVATFCKNIPSQLIALCGIHYDKVVTINSSSVVNGNEGAAIDWYGDDEEIARLMGHCNIPAGARVCKL